jgi:uncharacterized protein (DUF1330 family)
MPGALWVTSYRAITNAAQLALYAANAVPAIEAGGGRFLARGLPAKVFEDGLLERTVVIHFPSLQAALNCYESPTYQAALVHLKDACVRDLRIIEAIE